MSAQLTYSNLKPKSSRTPVLTSPLRSKVSDERGPLTSCRSHIGCFFSLLGLKSSPEGSILVVLYLSDGRQIGGVFKICFALNETENLASESEMFEREIFECCSG